jgi:hypothetical protein
MSGWLVFAGIVLLVAGLFNIIDGLVALFRSDYFLVTADQILIFNFAAWGWIWLIAGIIGVIVGLAVMAGQTWARVAGVVLAALVAVGHLAFLQAFPVWSVLVIALCVLIIYALTAGPQRAVTA